MIILSAEKVAELETLNKLLKEASVKILLILAYQKYGRYLPEDIRQQFTTDPEDDFARMQQCLKRVNQVTEGYAPVK